MIKVLLVDDHDLVRTGINRLLSDVRGIKIVGEASTGEEALKVARSAQPDVVIMDVKMPGIGGMEATRKLLRIDPDVKVLALTVCDEEPFPSRFLQAGAAGYITKGCDASEMVAAVRAVHVGQRYISADIAQRLALKQISKETNTPFDLLSSREMQIALMIVNSQKVPAISDQLCLSPKTVNGHRYKIFEKLNIESDVELTLMAVRYGIIEQEVIGQ